MMLRNHGESRNLRRALSMSGIAGGAMLVAVATANAGECPADKTGPNPLSGAATMPAGVSDTVLSSIDLSKEALKLNDRLFRLRRLEVQPGGVVPLHSHEDRPTLIYIVSGTITEYKSNCMVPIVHNAGEAAMESIGVMHWWKNTGSETTVLLSADLLHTETDDHHSM